MSDDKVDAAAGVAPGASEGAGANASAGAGTSARANGNGSALEHHLARLEGRLPKPPAPAGERPPIRRRNYVVDWRLQLTYTGIYLSTVLMLLVGFVTLNLIFYFLFQHMVALGTVRGPVDAPLDSRFKVYMVINAVAVLLLVIGMAVYAIVDSHRIAGPALRLRRSLDQVRRRDYDFNLRFREKDYLHEIADVLNALVGDLREKDRRIVLAAMELERVGGRLGGDDAQAVKSVARDLASVVEPAPQPPSSPPPAADAA